MDDNARLEWELLRGRIPLTRQSSTGDFGHPQRQSLNRDTNPGPSYYGPEFRPIEQGRPATVNPPLRQPEVPIPWRRYPDPWAPEVQRHYDHYKYDLGLPQERASTAYNSFARTGTPEGQEGEAYLAHKMALAAEARERAAQMSAARAGFFHKYPTAYHSADARETHMKHAWMSRGARVGDAERACSRRIQQLQNQHIRDHRY